MGKKVIQQWVPLDLFKQAEKLANDMQSSRSDAFNVLHHMAPIIVDTQLTDIPKSKKKRLTVIGRWEFEI